MSNRGGPAYRDGEDSLYIREISKRESMKDLPASGSRGCDTKSRQE